MAVMKVFSAAPTGFSGKLIEVESDTNRGLPGLQIVGLANKSIEEARERVKSAIVNSNLDYPAKKITINLAPAELPKDGAHYDVPIALSILASSGQLRQEDLNGNLFAGELALDGAVRPIKGAILLTEVAKMANLKTVYLPIGNIDQASLVSNIEVIGISSLSELYLHLKKEKPIPIQPRSNTTEELPRNLTTSLDDIIGQEQAKRAITIAAAGRHNLLLTGPPGTGKTMLARTLLGILPALSAEERIEVTKLHSLAGDELEEIITERPFRSPHHTATRASLIGGGTKIQPGEVSLAHLGVLFLDELPEYPRSLIESLRQPLEDKTIALSRANFKAVYPANFSFIATMNPCPCGFYGDPRKECSCSSTQILSYQKKISGPMRDRIDMTVAVARTANHNLLKSNSLSNNQQKQAMASVGVAKKMQYNRYKSSFKYNNEMKNSEVSELARLSEESEILLSRASERLDLSTRAYFKTIKVARTIADIDASDTISPAHVSEALQYRG